MLTNTPEELRELFDYFIAPTPGNNGIDGWLRPAARSLATTNRFGAVLAGRDRVARQDSSMPPPLGIIEGYCGQPWPWAARADTVAFLAGHGYRFYIYAPKADDFLRRQWREEHPKDVFAQLSAFAAHCRRVEVRFGVGLSPFEIYKDFGSEAKAALAAKLEQLDSLPLDILAILFDDMQGDLADLARTQAEIVHFAAARTSAAHVVMCPSYYSDDTELDRFFGLRPANYLEDLGAALDPKIDVFWCGEEICAREIGLSHIQRVAAQLRRRPFLWDNYPVNDGARMSQFLHLRPFTGRPAALGELIAGHAINPALQPMLTCIPALTLVESYARGSAYEYGAALLRAAKTVCGEQFGQALREDLFRLNEIGLDRLGGIDAKLRARYGEVDQAWAREIIAWLDRKYAPAMPDDEESSIYEPAP
jgi:hypothetical protein